MVACDGVVSLVFMLQSGERSNMIAGADVLGTLGCGCGPDVHDAIARTDAAAQLVQLIRPSVDVGIRKRALLSLCKLSPSSSQLRLQMVEAGCVQSAVEVRRRVP